MREANDVEIEFIALECGHSVTPNSGLGVCSECGKVCCGDCLQVVGDRSLCPECFEKRTRRKK